MNTKTKWIIFMAVVMTFSVLWPLSFMLRSHVPATNSTSNGSSSSQENVIRVINQYTGTLEANVTSVYPELFASAYANYGDPNKIQKIILNWTGVSGVNVSRVQSNNPNYLYSFKINVNTSSWKDNARIGFWLKKKLPLKVESVFEKLNISLPSELNLTSKSGLSQQIPTPKNIETYGYYYTSPGKNPVYVYVVMVGSEVKEAIAVAGNQFYLPPMENKKLEVNATIQNITSSVVIAKVPYGKKLNETVLSRDWNATVNYFPAPAEFICSINATLPSSVNYTVSDGHKIVKFNATLGPGNLSSRLPECHLATGVLRAVAGPSSLDKLRELVSGVGNVTKYYYLARVKIPKVVIIDGQNETLPRDFVDNVVTNETSGNLKIPITVSMAFGIPVGVTYGGEF